MYRELDATRKEIRLLKLEPGAQKEELHGSFEYTCLPTPHRHYETVSYAWGDASTQSRMVLSGRSLDIPTGAEAVLQNLRYSNKPRLLWIDSVCINQKIQREREAQVALMHEIYGRGMQNLIWLGPANESTPAAMRSIELLAREFKDATNDLDDINSFVSGQLATTAFKSTIDSLATLELYESPWFKRLWVVQEACLSPHSICLKGSFEISLIHVLRAACVLNRGGHFLSNEWRRTPHLRALTMAGLVDGVFTPFVPRSPGALQSLITEMSWFDCTDPRDRVYGVIGLYRKLSTRVELPQTLEPDYKSNTESVWQNATRQAIIDKNSLDILRYVSPFRDNTKLASWVPELSAKRSGWLPFPNFLVADNNEPMKLNDNTSSQSVLTVNGFCVDEVQCVKPALWQTPGSHRNAVEILARLSEIEELIAEDPQRIDSIACTMQMGADSFNGILSRDRTTVVYMHMKEYLTTHDTLPDVSSPKNENEQDIINLLTNIHMRGRQRSMFRTKTGYLGLGVTNMRPGDMVVILFGSNSPAILRPILGMESYYSFIGLAFVDGIMGGSLVEEHQVSNRPDTAFHLK
ncbi:hypothetical protein CKM354_000915700 [Cercospora kikuchii]|uniref:Heterokaryon incompatibility domain-containing protein n=1 Tax=Cercospora kikuchii TaxID=84275 RepID=A0A9P3CKA1_9PEZI|nr:uncharacterized protein CKM354_000915700 [Cercospora kikuchii]GIZ46014.1 hypothetical protein CKM354_000915700 [Cercospora kikuchii]